MKVSSFFRKIQLAAIDVPIAFVFLAISVFGCILAFSISKSALYLEGLERFDQLSKEVKSTVLSRINHTIELPRTVAQSIDFNATKGELDTYLSSLQIEARYPGIREIGIYSTKGTTLKRLYHYRVTQGIQDISEEELQNAVVVSKSATATNSSLLRFRDNESAYVLLTKATDGYLFTVLDVPVVLSRLFQSNGIYDAIHINISDAVYKTAPLFESPPDTNNEQKHTYSRTDQVKLGVYPWVITTDADLNSLIQKMGTVLPLAVLLFGISISLVIFYLLLTVGESRAKELQQTEEIKNSLQIGKDKYQNAVSSMQNEIDKLKDAHEEIANRAKELERLNRVMVGRELRMVELKHEIAKLNEKK
ncbi:MAG: hypothetical protein RL641_686 [Candidatus Parcubacteria bacterium]|jgi:hypothetical protein